MTKRAFDLGFAIVALALLWPVISGLALAIWLRDGANPFYRGLRVGRHGRDFRMIKLRTMVSRAEALGGVSTAQSDRRLTGVGRALRRWKLDELPQFWNVLVGEMSVVGPRPNVRARGVDGYSPDEMRLLVLRPGITDIASIVFADEGQIIDGAADPHLAYEALIRPWKSRLGLLYVQHRSMRADIYLIAVTLMTIVARPLALRALAILVEAWDGDNDLLRVCARRDRLLPQALPGLQP